MGLSMLSMLVLVLLCLPHAHAQAQSAHTQCSYVEDNLFTCDYSALTSSGDRPINYNNFSPEPQRLDLTVRGVMPYTGDTQVFSTAFSNIDTSAFDSNYPASLTLDCYGDGVILYTGAFADMSHIQTFKIRNCVLYDIPSQAFVDFGNIDRFTIDGGSISSIHTSAWVGLNVEKLTSDTHSVPRNLGAFEVLYTKFPTTSIPPGLLYNMKNLTSVTLKGTGVDSVPSDVFSYNSKLKLIDISDNDFISIPNGIFDNLHALAEVKANNIFWQCSCSNNWFVSFVANNNITFFGEGICSNADGKTVFKYYYENCVSTDPCEGATGFAIGDKCASPLSPVVMVLAFVAAGLVTAAMVIIVKESKQFKANDRRRRQAVGRWNIIINSTITKTKM